MCLDIEASGCPGNWIVNRDWSWGVPVSPYSTSYLCLYHTIRNEQLGYMQLLTALVNWWNNFFHYNSGIFWPLLPIRDIRRVCFDQFSIVFSHSQKLSISVENCRDVSRSIDLLCNLIVLYACDLQPFEFWPNALRVCTLLQNYPKITRKKLSTQLSENSNPYWVVGSARAAFISLWCVAYLLAYVD